jgi:hypothetical protein
VDLVIGQNTTIKTDFGRHGLVNAVGYNFFDHFLYGIQPYTNKLLRIASDGASQVLGFTPGRIDAGDVDSTGKGGRNGP